MRRWRVFFSMLVVLLIFVGFCFWYLKKYVVTKPHGIIVFVAPGLDSETLALARMRSKESKFLWFGRKGSGNLALVDSQCYRDRFADLPAILTTLATGEFTSNGYLGVNSRGQKLEKMDNLLYAAQAQDRMVGLVTSGRITSPGVAAFYASVTNAADEPAVLQTLLDSNINVIMGGGTPAFQTLKTNGGPDLIQIASAEGYVLADTKEKLLQAPIWKTWWWPQLITIVGEDQLPTEQQRRLSPAGAQTPTLADLVASAIEALQYSIGGYFLVVEDPSIAAAASKNQAINAVDQLLELDRAIATARTYAGEKALIFVYSPYSVGGLQITGMVPTTLSSADPQPYLPPQPAPPEPVGKKKALPETPAAPAPIAFPPVSWFSGPGGKPAEAPVPAPKTKPRGGKKTEPVAPLPPPDPTLLPQEPALLYEAGGGLPSAGYGFLFLSGPGLERTPVLMDVRELHDLLHKQF